MFYKFPSTPYIEFDKKTVRKDKVLSRNEIEIILNKEIILEEKIDGANLGISFSEDGKLLLQNRGSYLYPPFEGQWKILQQWIKRYEEKMFDSLTNEFVLFGEWCYATHTIYYDSLPDWFVGFDIFEKKTEKFLSTEKRNTIMRNIGISIVPMLGRGFFSLDDLRMTFCTSKFGTNICEGIYIRQEEGDYLNYRAKIVRNDFSQNIGEHWSKQEIRHNKIAY